MSIAKESRKALVGTLEVAENELEQVEAQIAAGDAEAETTASMPRPDPNGPSGVELRRPKPGFAVIPGAGPRAGPGSP